jgi:hypothetical protein
VARSRGSRAVPNAAANQSRRMARNPRNRAVGRLSATLLMLAAGAASLMASGSATSARTSLCTAPKAGLAYERRVNGALLSATDVWGNRLLATPNGPTYEAAARYLAPLRYASGPRGRALTTTGVYYLPFAYPLSPYGPRAFALHVADGSEIVTRRADGPRLSVFVGPGGSELYGSCARRSATLRLADGWLPILRTRYADAAGIRYRQESFAGRVPGIASLVSFVHLTADARASRVGAIVRLAASGQRRRLVSAASRYRIPAGALVDVYAVWLHRPVKAPRLDADEATYEAARAAVVRFWREQLGRGITFDVPDRNVMAAQRAVLVQQLALTWRYSIGNTYEELSFAEAQDVAQVLAAYGHADVAKAILRFSLRRLPVRFTSWRAGERLVAGGLYFRLHRDRSFLAEETPKLRRVLDILGARIARPGGGGLLSRELYSSDIRREVYGLHGQAVVWQGLREMGRVWAQNGYPRLAARCEALSERLGAGLRRALRASQRRLPDGSLFVPAALLDGGAPFATLTESRDASYWNLVVPYALASGLFPPDSAEARGLWRYMRLHGSRLLGLVRAGAFMLYGDASPPVSGTDQVYGLNVSRFLADNDEPDQLTLSLYGTLAAGMTPNTFVSGEGATVAPLEGAYHRTMFLPPNGGTNAAFLENLRLLLVHETRSANGAPRGLELAFATPRSWLHDGARLEVRQAPTSFGLVSYSIERHGRALQVTIEPPPSAASVRLRIRLPRGQRVGSVSGSARAVELDRRTATLEVSGRAGRVELELSVAG